MANDKKQVNGGDYVDIEIAGAACKVKKFTPLSEGNVVAWDGILDKDGKQIVCSKEAIKQVLEDHPHLADLFDGAIIENSPGLAEWIKSQIKEIEND